MHAIMIPYDMIHNIIMYTQELVRLERAANMIIIFIVINNN